MNGYIVLMLLVAHILGDFYFQWDGLCEKKYLWTKQGWKCLLLHFFIVLSFSLAAVWNWNAWWLALVIGVVHLVVDAFKSGIEVWFKIKKYEGEKLQDDEKKDWAVWSFLVDQVIHIGFIIGIVYIFSAECSAWLVNNSLHDFVLTFIANHPLECAFILAFLLVEKPANILILSIMKACEVQIPNSRVGGHSDNPGDSGDNPGANGGNQDDHGSFHSGKLIGYLERGLMLFFVVTSQYQSIGFLVTAKSILRYSQLNNKETEKTEYVLVGTLLSFTISLVLGLLVVYFAKSDAIYNFVS